MIHNLADAGVDADASADVMLMLMTGSDAGGVLATLKSVRPQSFSKRPRPPAIEICAPLTTTNTPRVKLDSTHAFKEHQKHAVLNAI